MNLGGHRMPASRRVCRAAFPIHIARDFGAKWRRRLLHEFLQQLSAPREVNSHEETATQDSEIEVLDLVTLPDDLLFKFFILLPAESLVRLQLVCKKWFGLINSSAFIHSHSQQSGTVLISKWMTLFGPAGSENKPKSYFHIMDLQHGGASKFSESSSVELVNVRASCDGLILAITGNNKSLTLMNPLTRKHIVLPLVTERDIVVESFAIASSKEMRSYKIIHVFGTRSGRTGCSIFSISTKKWARIEGPAFDLLLHINQVPISIGGSLYWLPKEPRSDFIVSMNVQDEIVSKNLPVRTALKDRLVEIRGNLGLVTHAEHDVMQVWVLNTEGASRESWIKKCSINVDTQMVPHPICCSENGNSLVLETRNELHLYNFETGEMKLQFQLSTTEDEILYGSLFDEYIPHRHTLVSWEDCL